MLSKLQAALRTPSGLVLLLANLIPVAGVIFWGWDVANLLYIYWAENVAVGLVNLLKLLTNRHPATVSGQKLFMSAFFAVHYGFFCYGHAMFVFGGAISGQVVGSSPGMAALEYLKSEPWLFLGFLASHLFSFVMNYHGKGEAEALDIGKVMFLPYARIFILHITIIFGGMAIVALGSPVTLIVVLAIAKTVGDLIFHRREHRETA